jgi:hypothetical protein
VLPGGLRKLGFDRIRDLKATPRAERIGTVLD